MQGARAAGFVVEEAEIVVHEADEPNTFVDLCEADLLTCQHAGDVDLLAVHADAAAGGDGDGSVVERIVEATVGAL